jgi:hypothetical protein
LAIFTEENFRRKSPAPHIKLEHRDPLVLPLAACVYMICFCIRSNSQANSKYFPYHFLHLILNQIFLNIIQILFFIIYTILHHFIIIVKVAGSGYYCYFFIIDFNFMCLNLYIFNVVIKISYIFFIVLLVPIHFEVGVVVRCRWFCCLRLVRRLIIWGWYISKLV